MVVFSLPLNTHPQACLEALQKDRFSTNHHSITATLTPLWLPGLLSLGGNATV